MTRAEIIERLRKYFKVQELVCDHTYTKWGEKAWQFLDTEILHTILVLREEILQVPMICNVHSKGVHQRGLRCNLCEEVQKKTKANQNYLSAHCNGAGFDFVFNAGMTAAHARELIKKHADLLPYPVRIERGVSWLHIDCFDDGSGRNVVEFNA